MQPKVFRKLKIWVIVTAAVDLIMLILAVVLDKLREGMPTEYTIADGKIISCHPLDRFGIAAAIALVAVTVMFAMLLIGALNGERKRRNSAIVGSSLLFAASVGIVMFSFFWVRGTQPQSTAYYYYTDNTTNIILMEERYAEDFGALKIFESDAARTGVSLLAATDINSHSDSSEDYKIGWGINNMLSISFIDGTRYRQLEIDLDAVKK